MTTPILYQLAQVSTVLPGQLPGIFLPGLEGSIRYTALMDVESKLVEILSQPGVHSGTDIGLQLGISRVAVKKRVSALINQGLPVEAIQGKGYRLLEGVELLSEARIREAIEISLVERLGVLEVLRAVPSTNAYLQTLGGVETGLARVAIAESQPEGKGRRGRGWITTPYRNLMLSVAWRYAQWPKNPSALSLAFAVAVHQALVAAGSQQALIKWPNDILLDGRKLSGLLVDANGEASGGCNLVFGVGVNFFLDAAHGELIDQPWAHLSSEKSVNLSRNALAAGIVSNLIESLDIYEKEGFSPFAHYWNEHAAYVGQKVRLFNSEAEYQGVLLGVDESGELLLKDASGKEHRFTQADISLRPII